MANGARSGGGGRRRWVAGAAVVVLVGAGAVFAALRLSNPPPIEVPVAEVQRGAFVVSVKGRGEIKSTRSVTVVAPRSPESRIVRLADAGKVVKQGDVVVELDPSTQEQYFLQHQSNVRQIDSEIVQLKAQHKIIDEQDATLLMQAEYNLERAKLEASKQEILSEIQGAKNRIDVTIAEGDLGKVQATIEAHKQTQQAELDRLNRRRDKVISDMKRAQGYLDNMVLRAPADGMVNILNNSRGGGGEGMSNPPYKPGDRTFPGSALIELPDLTQMRVEIRIEEVDRGMVQIGQLARIRVDAVPDLELAGSLEWINPIAQLVFRTFPPEKNFPARVAIQRLDPRLRPGMSATAEIIIEKLPDVLWIPLKASFVMDGKPGVFLKQGDRYRRQTIQVGKRNATDMVVTAGLAAGQQVALEDPDEAARKRMGR